MAQTGYTPISLYYSTTAAAVPVNTNLANGELAINITDGKLYYKDNGGTVRLLASNATSAPVLSFQTSLGGLTPSTATTGVVTLAGTLNTTSGGTGLTSFTAGDVPYYASGTLLSKLAIGTAGQFLTSTGTAPQWSTLSGVAVTTFSAGTTGFTPSSATSGAVTLAGTLGTANGGTNLTSFTSGGVVYASSSSALATGSSFTYDGSGSLSVTSSSNVGLNLTSTSGYSQLVLNGGSSANYIVSDDPLSFYVNGSETFRATSSSLYTASGINVGIGTSNPTAKVYVVTAPNSQGLVITDNTSSDFEVKVGVSTGVVRVGSPSGAMSFSTVNTERARIDSSGNLLVGSANAAGRIYSYTTSNQWAMYAESGISTGLNSGILALVSAQNSSNNSYKAIVYYNAGAGVDRFSVADSGAIATAGSISLGTTVAATSGIGVQFPATQSASSDANTLDDYEEGTFTPTVQGDAPAGTASYALQNGAYVKVGKLVSFQIYVSWTSGTGSGNLFIGGLPFTSANNTTYPAAALGYVQDIALTANATPLALLTNNDTRIYFYQVPSGGGSNIQLLYDSAGTLIIAGTYQSAS